MTDRGTGAGISSLALSVLINTLFDQYRGVASGIKYAGASLSSLIFAQILVLMQKAYGLRGTFLLCGGIMIHSTALVIPLKEPLWKKPRHTLHELQKVHENEAIDTIGQHQSHSPQGQSPSERTALLQLESAWKCLRFFQKPIFYVVILYSLLGDYSSLTFQTTFVDYAMDKGFSLTVAESLVMYNSTIALLGGLVIPLIADWKFLRRSTLVTISCFVLACALLILPHVRSFSALFVTALFAAMFLGTNASIKTVLMADYLGVDGISTCWAILGPAAVPVWLCNPAIIGKFRSLPFKMQTSWFNLFF
ncbi:monocarboxylate transporter 1-like [Ixodes scapularis]|uniref:monocarboxylate transporter 1-like n=1 Tax=Ixodes scapularis TaxID=6945 RepID=UPI001C393C10|nr:monocarboxylate transporter 1-like [Ixodes scapularis]